MLALSAPLTFCLPCHLCSGCTAAGKRLCTIVHAYIHVSTPPFLSPQPTPLPAYWPPSSSPTFLLPTACLYAPLPTSPSLSMRYMNKCLVTQTTAATLCFAAGKQIVYQNVQVGTQCHHVFSCLPPAMYGCRVCCPALLQCAMHLANQGSVSMRR